jgi:large subunit ribosomal protein L28
MQQPVSMMMARVPLCSSLASSVRMLPLAALAGSQGRAFSAIPGRAKRGLYHGVGIQYGYKPTWSGKKTKRRWLPNVHRKKFFSDILGETLEVKLTSKALRTIDKYGGFDNYILRCKTWKLVGKKAHDPENYLAIKLRTRMKERLAEQTPTSV